ncbi:MAG: hypothetical protein LBE23_13465 [Vagococcus sp.]|jgi:ABC-2 type transport system permease protein|nr:hypothetical protein [Vagococcus sp.]
MTAKLIFKMELFKYMRDKRYLITTGILAIINICTTIYLVHLIDQANYISDTESTFIGLFFIFFTLTMFANFAFMFLYPFHLMSMDYKNDVMAMLVASGVNRTRLFFSKIGATLLWSLCVTIVLVFIPGFIVLLKISQTTGMFQMISQLLELMNINSLSIFGVSFTFLNSYLNTLILISAATILMKGRNLTILVYFGFNIAQSMILGFLAFIPSTMDFSNTGISIFNNLTMILVSCGMILLSLRIMKKQNL